MAKPYSWSAQRRHANAMRRAVGYLMICGWRIENLRVCSGVPRADTRVAAVYKERQRLVEEHVHVRQYVDDVCLDAGHATVNMFQFTSKMPFRIDPGFQALSKGCNVWAVASRIRNVPSIRSQASRKLKSSPVLTKTGYRYLVVVVFPRTPWTCW